MDVSVIMPAYNTDAYISEAIESIVCQNFSGQMELLIADDNSSDRTKEIISVHASQYPGIIKTIYRNENKGVSVNYAELAGSASGTYLAFCDSDDIWLSSEKIQVQFDFLEQHPEYGMVCSASSESVDEVTFCGKELSFIDLIYGHTDVVNSSIMVRKSLFSKMMKESSWFINNCCFFDTVWSFWFSYYSRIWLLDSPLAMYRQRDESDCRTRDAKKRFELDKRYFLIKTQFLLSNDIERQTVIDVLLSEYDYLYKNAEYIGEKNVRNSKAYKIGKQITSCVLWRKRIKRK